VLLNRGGSALTIPVEWKRIGYPDHVPATVRDLWEHKELGKFTGEFSATVPPHGVVMVIVRP